MKIAVIGTKGLPPKQGGIEHYCAELYPRIVAAGHSVDLYARSSYNNCQWFETYDYKGVRVITLPSVTMKGVDAFVTSALGAIAASGKQYDVIHFHALGPSLFTWIPKISSSAKIVVTCQGLDWQRAKWGTTSTFLIQSGEKAAVRCAHEVVVVSDALRSYFAQTYGRKTVYIPNAPAGYPDTDPSFPFVKQLGLEQGKYMLFLGRLVPEKRPNLLIEAFQNLNPDGWKLVLVGGGSDTNVFTSAIREMASGNPNIIFAGELRGERLAEIVRGAGLFTLPSDLEGLPLAMLEGIREGIPVVASDIPPHQQVLNEQRGTLFQAGNLESCMSAMDWAIHHPEEIAQMAKKAKKYVDTHHTWEKITADHLKLYTTLCNSSKQKAVLENSFSDSTDLAPERSNIS
jgi:glycosyltransferase involved in cell wall biosynthesis